MIKVKSSMIKIVILIAFLMISYAAWKKRMLSLRERSTLSYYIFDQTGDIRVENDIMYYVKLNKCRAFSRICPHLGCKLSADNKNRCFVCPCHGSKFSLDGIPIKGPATERLREYKCEVLSTNHVRIYLDDK